MSTLVGRIGALIRRLADGSRDDAGRDALLSELQAYQAQAVPPYGRLVEQARAAGNPSPALPTDVFRYARVASFGEAEEVRVFRTSGTTLGVRGAHPFRDLSLYDQAARAAAAYALFPEGRPMRLLVLAPGAEAVPDSSLSYMLGRFLEWFGTPSSEVLWGDGGLKVPRLVEVLAGACRAAEPVALLGTSFAFVHAEDALGEVRFQLPVGSRVMQTGGFKGRSREVAPEEMTALLAARYGVPAAFQAQEYGMTELSSQMYSAGLRQAVLGGPAVPVGSRFWVPGWVRVQAVDPETLKPVTPGETGILRIDDLANVDSVSAIQTSDMARVVGQDLYLLGRAPGAVPRGCSLAIEEALG